MTRTTASMYRSSRGQDLEEEDGPDHGLNIIGAGFFLAAVFGFYYYLVVRPAKQSEERERQVAQARHSHEGRYVLHGAQTVAPERFSLDDVKNAVSSIAMNARLTLSGEAGNKSKVVAVKSERDNNIYFVADDLGDKERAADKFAEINRRAQTLLQAIDEQLDGSKRIVAEDGTDITDNMKQLVRKHYRKPAVFAEYHNPGDLTVGSNSDKGELIEMCLRSKDPPHSWNSDNTLFRVHVHELAHSADFHFRDDGEEGHGPEFRRLHQYLLGVAENLGIYDCEEYKRSGKKFCGLVLNESYDCGEEKAKNGGK